MLHYHVMFYTRHYISVYISMSLISIAMAYMPPRLFQCTTAASVHLFSDSSMHNQSIDLLEYPMRCYWSIGHVMLVINLWCIRCMLRLYRTIYEMLLTYKHVMLVTNLWCIRCMIRFYHACSLCILSNATVCQCDRMLLSMMHSMHISDVASCR